MTERSPPIEFNAGGGLRAVSFSANGEYLVSGHWNKGVRVWLGKHVATMEAKHVYCLAVSNDGRWIAAGTFLGNVCWWDTMTHERVLEGNEDGESIFGVDFSPDSTQLVSASLNHTAVVWDLETRKRVHTLSHENQVLTAKYSPHGGRIATATPNCVRLWDSNDGRLLLNIQVAVIPWYNTGLLWLDSHLFVVSDGKIVEFDVSTGSTVSEWPVPDTNNLSRIVLQKHEGFIAYATKCIVTFWDTSTHSQIGQIQYPEDICSIAFSPDGQLLAVCGQEGTITIQSPSCSDPISLAYAYFFLGNLYMESGSYDNAIRSFEHAHAQMGRYDSRPSSVISLTPERKFDNLDVTVGQRLCEALYSAGRTKDASESLLELVRTFEKEAWSSEAIVKWVSDFTQQCLSTPESDGNAGSNTIRDTSWTTLHPNLTPLLREWAKATLINRTWREALVTAVAFITPRFAVYRVVCERLEATDRITDATECLLEMASEISQETDVKQMKWFINLKYWCGEKLQELGDVAMSTRQHDRAIIWYSAALSLNPIKPQTLFVKRSKAQANMGSWEVALSDANEVIMLDPSSPLGYERKHAALRVAGCYGDAEVAFETMLSKMLESADPEIRERSRRYIKPAETEAAIREAVQITIRESPLVLINTDSGRLLDKPEQAFLFESQPIFHELISSTTTYIDRLRIEDEIGQYYRYATFSHKWKDNEPLFERVKKTDVYKLEQAPTHHKLRRFCEVVRDAGLHWAWSDTCCINKADPSALQEALVSMFQWYQSSTLTVVLLCDVPLRRLADSIWNTRAWTFQEYHASKVVRFYDKDWMLYRNLTIPNHKMSSEIIAEMEEATGISVQALMSLRPGLGDIRKKLRLASMRQSTRVEDAAYSLLGIFSLSMPVVYGEGDRALGQLLAKLLTSSGDTGILAWTGRPGGFNSCLPAQIAVFSQLPTSYIPPPITGIDMETAIARMHNASLNLTPVTRLYDRLNELPVPSFYEQRMKLPSIVFKLGPLSVSHDSSERVFRARTTGLGIVEIKTEEDLSQCNSLTLVHPWIDFLLDRQPDGSAPETTLEKNTGDQYSLIGELPSRPGPSDIPSVVSNTPLSLRFPRFKLFGGQISTPHGDVVLPQSASDTSLPRPPSDTESLQPPSTLAEIDKQLHALRVLARLRQPFGALLLTPDPNNVAAYKRVAAESLITVQVNEITPALLDKLIGSVCILDVL